MDETGKGGVSIFVCGRESPPCVECGSRSSTGCDFALKGHRAGLTCSRALCERCSSALGNLCAAHYERQRVQR